MTDPHRIILLSDLHVDGNLDAVERGVNMAENVRRVVATILSLQPEPACVLVNGDCAHHWGKAEDYAALWPLLQPLLDRGLPLHLSMGNHDHRENFQASHPSIAEYDRPVPDRYSRRVETAAADFYMLDTLGETNGIPGYIGQAQLAWLTQTLDERPTKPAIILSHHQPDLRPERRGIVDTEPLLQLLDSRKQVKAHFFGHTHAWKFSTQPSGVYWINLPPVAYLLAEGLPAGWVDLQLSPGGATLQLHSLDRSHTEHGRQLQLTWRDDA